MDPLDWLHQWDDYEMVMYVSFQEGDDGIFMQVSQRKMYEGAEEWEILYDRKIAELPSELEVAGQTGSEEWEERALRHHLNGHPQLVNDEKEFLQHFLTQS
ncbi:MAG: hypothetical protein A2201_08090 [Alicyclobacillus sp. RIFOXYA1_FULL_53_8]|nr:MAG: hypothetical protein A2201_08090 [Alicyclobacillus sp. RIFOXYA1_FULL_53_8]